MHWMMYGRDCSRKKIRTGVLDPHGKLTQGLLGNAFHTEIHVLQAHLWARIGC